MIDALVIGDNQTLVTRISEILTHCGCAADGIRTTAPADANQHVENEHRLVVAIMTNDAGDDAILRSLGRFHCPRVAIGPADDPKYILRILRQGASEYLDEGEIEVELPNSLMRLGLQGGDLVSNDSMVVGVLSPSGGCGASTIAANLAVTLADKHERCGLVDLRLTAGDLGTLLDLKSGYTLADLCQADNLADRALFQQHLTRHNSGVYLLGAPASRTQVSKVTATGVGESLRVAGTCFPSVVIDLDRTLDDIQCRAISQCDAIVLAMRLDIISLRNTRRTLEVLERLDVPTEYIHIAINQYGLAQQLPYRQAEQVLGLEHFHYLPDDASWVNRCLNQGVPVVTERPKSKFSKGIVALATALERQRKDPRAQRSRADNSRNSASHTVAASFL